MESASPRSPLDDGEIVDEESKEFNDGYDENLMGDEEDRRKLALMTEKEREQELFNRSERRETLKVRFEIERKLRNKAKKREQAEKKPPKQVRGRKRLRASEIYSSDGSSEESDEYTPDANPKILNEINSGKSSNPKMTTRSALLSSSSSSSSEFTESSESSSSESQLDNGAFEEDEIQVVQEDFDMTLADLRSLQLRRDKIEEWIYAPFFKETAIGLFVKISVGNHPLTKMHMYKVAQIIGITTGSRVYPINQGRNKTDKQCVVRIGQVERTYNMSFVSNRVFDEEDYDKWKDQVNSDGQEMPTREYFLKKKQDLKNAINFQFKDEDIVYQINEKKRFNELPYNLALRKTELLAERGEADSEMNFEKVRIIQAQIDELEERARELEKQRSSEKFSGISIVNERNRERNIKESERALKEYKNVKTEDPFTRRKCTPTIVHNKKDTTSTSKDNNITNNNQQSNDKNGKTTADNNSNGTDKARASESDLFSMHSKIDLGIDLDI